MTLEQFDTIATEAIIQEDPLEKGVVLASPSLVVDILTRCHASAVDKRGFLISVFGKFLDALLAECISARLFSKGLDYISYTVIKCASIYVGWTPDGTNLRNMVDNMCWVMDLFDNREILDLLLASDVDEFLANPEKYRCVVPILGASGSLIETNVDLFVMGRKVISLVSGTARAYLINLVLSIVYVTTLLQEDGYEYDAVIALENGC